MQNTLLRGGGGGGGTIDTSLGINRLLLLIIELILDIHDGYTSCSSFSVYLYTLNYEK